MRIPKGAGHRVAVREFRQIGFICGIGVVTGGKLLLLTEEALAASDYEGHHDPLSDLQPPVSTADLHYAPHELVTQNVTGLHARDVVIIQMQVRSADRGRGDLDDGIARIDNLWIRDRFNPDIVFSLPGQSSHEGLLLDVR